MEDLNQAGRFDYDAPRWVDLSNEPCSQPPDHDDDWFHTVLPLHPKLEPG